MVTGVACTRRAGSGRGPMLAIWFAHARMIFGAGHWGGLLLVLSFAGLWPASGPDDLRFLRFVLGRLEWLAPIALLGLTQGLIIVRGRVDERWAASPMGLGRVFLQRWLLSAAYLLLCLCVLCCLVCVRASIPHWWRQALSSFVTAAFFAAVGSLVHHLAGSERAGWTVGMASLLAAVAVAGRWCPSDVAHQIWLPFLGQSPATAGLLVLNKLGYALAAGGLLAGSLRSLEVPEALLRKPD